MAKATQRYPEMPAVRDCCNIPNADKSLRSIEPRGRQGFSAQEAGGAEAIAG